MDMRELDELVNTFAEGDREAARALLTRNAGAQSHLDRRETVYRAFVGGDSAALNAISQPATSPAVVAPPAAVTPPAAVSSVTSPTPAPAASVGITLDQINALLNERERNFETRVEARAKEIAAAELAAARPGLIGAGAEIADTITQIHNAHFREFNEPLDSAKFKEFFQTNGPQYGNNLLNAYNAFVQEKRIEKRIKDGVEAGMAARETSQVPGTALPTANNPLAPNFIDYNTKKIGDTAATPPADVDAAAQAFHRMRTGWAN